MELGDKSTLSTESPKSPPDGCPVLLIQINTRAAEPPLPLCMACDVMVSFAIAESIRLHPRTPGLLLISLQQQKLTTAPAESRTKRTSLPTFQAAAEQQQPQQPPQSSTPKSDETRNADKLGTTVVPNTKERRSQSQRRHGHKALPSPGPGPGPDQRHHHTTQNPPHQKTEQNSPFDRAAAAPPPSSPQGSRTPPGPKAGMAQAIPSRLALAHRLWELPRRNQLRFRGRLPLCCLLLLSSSRSSIPPDIR